MKAKVNKKHARDVAYWSEAAFLSFTEGLLRLMGDSVTQAELARRVGVSRGYISRVLRGHENLTLETMTRLALAVGGSVRLHVAPQDQATRWTDAPRPGDEPTEELHQAATPRGRGSGALGRLKEPPTASISARSRHHK